jgi:putative DNA primase/helicase
MIDVARKLEGMTLEPGKWDADPRAFNCQNGIIGLRTGKIRPHHANDYFTQISPVSFDENADDTIFTRVLNDSFGNDAEAIGFLQCAIGHCLAGDTPALPGVFMQRYVRRATLADQRQVDPDWGA